MINLHIDSFSRPVDMEVFRAVVVRRFKLDVFGPTFKATVFYDFCFNMVSARSAVGGSAGPRAHPESIPGSRLVNGNSVFHSMLVLVISCSFV